MKDVDVKFGISVPSGYPDEIITYLGGLEDHFDSAWIVDHPASHRLECLITISYLSGVSEKFNFGSIVLCNSYRNPALVAKMGATLDFLTGGRFILGIGAGWLEEEYVQYGYDFPSPAVRIKQLEEGVQIIKRMWTEDEVTFEGKYFTVKNARCDPKPDPPPPIMIGGMGEKLTLKVVARYADWWNVYLTPCYVPDFSTYEHKLNVLEHHCSRIGRDFDEIVKTLWGFVAIADTDKKALEIAKEYRYGDHAHFVGTLGTVKDEMRAFVDIGVEHFILTFLPFPRLDGPLLFAEEVVPEFQ